MAHNKSDKKTKDKNNKSKSNKITLIIAIVFLCAGLILLTVDPIKDYLRNRKIDEYVNTIESQIEDNINNNDQITNLSITVPVNGNEVEGEDYDYFGNDENERRRALEAEFGAYGDQVTLNGIGVLEIPAIDLRVPVWETATIVSLRYGAGHYADSVMPGEEGNCSILGHHLRAYGSMFNRLGEVEVGDSIVVQMLNGDEFTYIVDRTFVVDPMYLVDYIQGSSQEGTAITLVTCTYSGEEKLRLLVVGHLEETEQN